MLTRIYNWLTAPWRAETQFEADKEEGYQYAKRILETCPVGTEKHTADVMLAIASRDGDGYDIGVLMALRDHYKKGA
jgi:hypothetical protein